MPYSPRETRPITLRLTLTTPTALLDTLTRFYSVNTKEQQGIVLEEELAGVQGVLRGEGSSQEHQAVHAHTSR